MRSRSTGRAATRASALADGARCPPDSHQQTPPPHQQRATIPQVNKHVEPPAGYPRSVTSGQGSSWRLSLPGQLPLAVIPLIALKLAGIIGWSWWWVLAPLWGSVVVFVALIGGLLLLLIRSQRPEI